MENENVAFDTEKVQQMLSKVSCLEDLTAPGGVMEEMLKKYN